MPDAPGLARALLALLDALRIEQVDVVAVFTAAPLATALARREAAAWPTGASPGAPRIPVRRRV